MAVLAVREVSGRGFTHRFGEAPTAERKFVATMDASGISVNAVGAAIGIYHGSPHPEFGFLTMTEANMTEGSPSPFHAEVTFRYELVDPDERDPNPLARPDIWTFAAGGAAKAIADAFDPQGAIANTAGDIIEGVTTEEDTLRATITGNRATFPLDQALRVINTVNDAVYLNEPAHTWKCTGITGQQQIEMVNDAELRFWSFTTELSWRRSGWKLKLPNVGYNFLENGVKKRAFVIDPDTGERVPCVNPVPLNANGTLKPAGQEADIIEFRVNSESNFDQFFGTPSWL